MIRNSVGPLPLLLGAALLATWPAPGKAQRASEKASLLQEIAGASLTIEYSRPVARGRAKLFGGVVHWGEIWTPGANWATTLDVSRDFTLNGHAVPQGKYSMWMIPAEQGDWTVFLSGKAKRFHTQRPRDTSDDVVRFTVKPEPGRFMETLTFYFPEVKRDGATLRMHWGETFIPLQFGLGAPKPVALTPEQISQYVGEYKHRTTQPEMPERIRDFLIWEKDGALMGRYLPNPQGNEFEFVHIGNGRFNVIMVNQGVKLEQLPGEVIFTVVNGVTHFRLGEEPLVIWSAERVKK